MSLIEAKDLTKDFIIIKKEEGLIGSLKSIFNKKYTNKKAVDNVNFKVDEGESVAYVGPNGAGKSTTLKMLTGILVPTSGSVNVDGLIPYKNRIRNAMRIGVVFGQRTQLWWDIPVIESFKLLRDIYKIPDEIYKKNMGEFNEVLGISELYNTPVRQLSLGQRMRCEITASLLHNPKIVYLDEPTIGLDVLVKEKLRNFIKHVNETRKTTIMLTSHDLGDIEDICRRIIIIDKGCLVYDRRITEFKDKFLKERVIHFHVKPESYYGNIRIELDFPGVTSSSWSRESLYTVQFNKDSASALDIVKIVMGKMDVLDFTLEETKIETVIKAVYEGTFDIGDEAV